MRTIQTKDGDGSVVIFGNPAHPPAPKAGYTIRTVDAIPARPAGDKTNVLLWQNDVLAWVIPTPTPQQAFDAAVAAGFTYPVPGSTPALTLVLDLGDGARAQFTGLMVLLNAMMQEGQILATSNQAIADKAGVLHLLTVAQIQAMLLAYGAYYAGLFNALHAATTAVAPAAPAS